jgi:peptide subunit release factor 1 (eRF1)
VVEKIRSLPPEKIDEVEDFVDFLAQRSKQQTTATAVVSSDDAARKALMQEIAEGMRANSFTGNPPRFTREELHERR